MKAIRLVVGLGNPGREYEKHRHNAGFWWVAAATDLYPAQMKLEGRFQGILGRAKLVAHELFFFLPQTFMNASGRAVGAVAHFYKIPPDEILVVHDELDLPPGESRIKLGGGHAGHNGLKDIVNVLGTPDFWRLRLGIGHPGTREEVVNYVLNKPPESELSLVEEVIHQSLQGLPFLAQGLYPEAQARINIRRKAKE